MTTLESAENGLIELLEKHKDNTELSIELQTIYTLLEAHKQDMAASSIPICPQGEVYSPSANKCIPNVG
jgi:hypothetical protein